jgi:aspartate/methionine/tyrosine aminotransferase
MLNQNINLCIRCGKQRVVVKTKKEYINSSLVLTTTTVCPDDDCQKIVDAMLNKEKEQRDVINKNHERDKQLREDRFKRKRRRLLRAKQNIKA